MTEPRHLDFENAPPRTDSAAPTLTPADRGVSPVAGRIGGRGAKIAVMTALLLGCGAVCLLMIPHARGGRKEGAGEPVRQVVSYDSVKAKGRDALPGDDSAAAGAQPAAGSNAVLAASTSGETAAELNATLDAELAKSSSGVAGDVAAAGKPGHEAEQTAALQSAARAQTMAIRSAPLVTYDSEHTSSNIPAVPDPDASAAALVRTEPPGTAAPLDGLRRGSSLDLVRAGRLPDRNFLIAAGALLPCVLETALDTSAPGYVTCLLSQDVYSDNGHVLLLEKGSRAIGEYRGGPSVGQARIFVLWDRIATPGGVVVDVRSPASDALGRAGFGGEVDTHFWARFGGALMLSAVNGAFSAAAAAESRYPGLLQSPQDAASVTLQNTLNIAPTLTKPQGAQVAIMVSRDLDFSRVYALKAR